MVLGSKTVIGAYIERVSSGLFRVFSSYMEKLDSLARLVNYGIVVGKPGGSPSFLGCI